MPRGEEGESSGWPDDSRWLDALTHPVISLDRSGRVIGCNVAARATLAEVTGDVPRGERFADAFLETDDRGGFAEVLQHAFEGTRWRGELGLRRVDAAGRTELQVVPILRGDTVESVLVVASPVAGGADRAVALAERLTRLARVGSELLSAATLDDMIPIVVERMAEAAGATTSSLSVLLDDDTLALIGIRGGLPGAASRWATYAVAASTPAGEAARTGQPVVLIGRDEIHERFPDLEKAAAGERSIICLPLVVAGTVIGVTSMSFPGRRDLDAAELEFFCIMADVCAQALERIRARDEAAEHAAKLEFLAQASATLASSLDYQATLRRVAWLAVPGFADWAAVALVRDGRLETLAVAHTDPEKLAIAEEYQRRFPPDPDATTGGYAVLRTGQSQLTAEITDELLVAAATDPAQLEMLRALGMRSGMVVPLKARGRTIGTMTWVSGETGRRFSPADVAFGEQIAVRAATAIDNSELHSELRTVAERLQREVLPPALPQLPGWELAVRYVSAGRTQVGGDFYDVIPLGDDRIAVFVGDVMGRGVQAAAAMAKVSASVRTLVAVNPDPASLLERLDLIFERYPSDQLVTLAYAVLDPAGDSVTIASAGHPAPLLVGPDGTAEFVEDAAGLLLGAGPALRTTATLPFRPGATLLMFSDGLLERGAEDPDLGRQRVLEAVRAYGSLPVSALVERLAVDVPDPSRNDDLALLAVRRQPD